MVEGESGLLSVCPPHFMPEFQPSNRQVIWPNGAMVTLFSAEEPNRLRGPQHEFAWCDELCLAKGTLIACADGDRPIESVRAGDRVWTRKGLRRVAVAAASRRVKPVWTVTTECGRTLEGSSGHPVFVYGSGFVHISHLKPGDLLCVRDTSSGTASAGTRTSATGTTAIGGASSCTAKSTRRLTGLCRRISMSITATKIAITTISKTSLRSRVQRIFASISLAGLLRSRLSSVGSYPGLHGSGESLSMSPVSAAGPFSRRPACAPNTAVQPAASAITRLPDGSSSIPTRVTGASPTTRLETVYNLEVEGEGEYFAGGILTHNCAWQYLTETWDMLQFGLRLGKRPQVFISTTPKPSKVLRWIIDQAKSGMTALTTGSTYANKANLAPAFLNAIIKRYEGTRLGRQELLAELLEDNPDALWQLGQIDALRVTKEPGLSRIVVAVDPPTTSGEGADECGIIVCGLGQENKHGYVLADRSVHRMRPQQWMDRVVQACRDYDADLVVAEINQGGEMVEDLLRGIDANIRYKGIHAKRGKFLRAEPVSALYEQMRVHHVGTHSKLEDQMTDFTPDFDPDRVGYSPDRLDALVYGLSELMFSRSRGEPQIRRL